MDRRAFLGCVGCAGAAAFSGCALLRRECPTATAARKPEDLAYCGVDCTACDVYKATVHGDEEARRRAHKPWEKTAQIHWGVKTLDPAILNCKGCRTEGNEVFKGCRLCPIRRCCRERGLASCGLCPGWRDCERLTDLFADEPQTRTDLEAISASAK